MNRLREDYEGRKYECVMLKKKYKEADEQLKKITKLYNKHYDIDSDNGF